jgi:hypothetical protein
MIYNVAEKLKLNNNHSKKFKIFPSRPKISPGVKFTITGHLKGCTERYRNNRIKTSQNDDNRFLSSP